MLTAVMVRSVSFFGTTFSADMAPGSVNDSDCYEDRHLCEDGFCEYM